MNKSDLLKEAIDKIATERAEMIDTFVAAILKVREANGENIDMNYVALEHGQRMDDKGAFTSTLKVVYTKETT